MFIHFNILKLIINHETVSDNLDNLEEQLLPIVNPVLSSVIKNGVLKGYIFQ